MSKEFSRIPLEHLCSWILNEYAQNSIFGIHKSLFFTPNEQQPYKMDRYGVTMETPLGVAAGPHTQMAQNIIAAWLCGARYLELKTVQTLDQLNVSKPCIDMQDEGYNCEWSQELRLGDSYEEYLNAWILLHLLRHRFGWKKETGPGFLFNMSVGYNMEGILKDNVQVFLDKMENAGDDLKKKIQSLKKLYPKIDEIEIPSRLSDNITLSTMHGCPPDEIEKIGMYLVTQRKYHTTIKLNPTLLGPEQLRTILNQKLGFETWVPDEAFGHDLKYPDALTLIRNLREASRRENRHFALKLTNTLESVNHKSIFPANEKMMYMSGRALHAISINVAAKLQNEFDGELDISFSAGADCFNVPEIIACGIKPITVCSDILKPGGYARLSQYLEELGKRMSEYKSGSFDEFILAWDGRGLTDVSRAALTTLRQYAGTVVANKAYHRSTKTSDSVKTSRELPGFDCVAAPCIATCPANQDIPSYLYYTGQGDFKKAYEVIARTNPFPNVLGMVCDHQCQHKCTRSNYDSALLIREVKRFIAEQHQNRPNLKPAAANGKSVAIIGAGPSGLACAYFLALEGFAVTVHETKTFSGGMVADAIPAFRLTNDAINKDVEYIKGLGVKIQYDSKIDKERFANLRREFDYLYVAIGAQAAKRMGIPGENTPGILDCLKFLSDVRQGKPVTVGTTVAVIGGGNTAMDVARTAHRLAGPQGKVTVLYRRSRKEMPADPEEIHALLDEGIEIRELTAPLAVILKDGKAAGLKVQSMRLGAKGADGRASFEAVPGSEAELLFDTIIPAIGQDVVPEFVEAGDLKIDPATGMTRIKNVYAGGDVVRGGATIIKAVGDGRRVAHSIIFSEKKAAPAISYQLKKGLTPEQFQERSARRIKGLPIPEIDVSLRKGFQTVVRPLTKDEAVLEAKRCLYCNDVCNVCVTVCPNRANFTYTVTPQDYPICRAVKKGDKYQIETIRTLRLTQDTQVGNIGDFCNECANCTMFCPSSGDPYKTKPKFYLTEESWNHEKNGYRLTPSSLKSKVDGHLEILTEKDGALQFQTGNVKVRLHRETLMVESVKTEGKGPAEIVLERAVTMAVLFKALHGSCWSH